jgi:hypothetical protein
VIYVINYGRGPRIDRYRALWRREVPEAIMFPARESHRASLDEIARHAALRGPLWYTVTELDFLPRPDALRDEHAQRRPGLVAYRMRDDVTRRLEDWDGVRTGGWFAHLPATATPDFGGTDPGNRLLAQFPDAVVFEGEDAGLAGIEYPFGQHLFYSRHDEDPDHFRPSGIALGDLRRAQEAALANYE